ncbi:MAG: hypothetical protein Q9M97_07940 [Candidatus Gracilibacteria bacterium]|nr:hypothetical protein [Candidatus Gracilibacteria bacterium]
MDVCNETNGDKSGDYYDGKCLKDENTSEEEIEEENQEEEKTEEENQENSLIKYTKEDIEKYNVSENNVIKYKSIIEKRYGKKIARIADENLNRVVIKIDLALNKVFKS